MKNGLNASVMLWILCGCSSTTVLAAPLDDLLTANTPKQSTVKLEAAYDAVNSTLDVLKIRANDPVYGGTNVGDYSGEHLLAGYALTDRMWLDGGLWDRHISYHSNVESLRSWQTALQYRLAGTPDSASSYGLRIGAWGDSAGNLSKSTAASLFGQQLSSINVSHPEDIQYQADLLGSWSLVPHLQVSAFTGAGLSTVRSGDLTAGLGGCQYAVSLNASSVTGAQIGQCGDVVSASFYKPTSYDVSHSLAYKASFSHLGLNWRWNYARWTVKGGYLLELINRRDVDTLVTTRLSGTAYKRNNVLDGEIAWLAGHDTDIFVRAEVMSNQFVGEIPFAYNAVTASKFSGKYGLMSFGLRSTF